MARRNLRKFKLDYKMTFEGKSHVDESTGNTFQEDVIDNFIKMVGENVTKQYKNVVVTVKKIKKKGAWHESDSTV